MRVIATKTLLDCCKNHADSEQPLKAWLSEAKAAEWKSPHDITERYPKASILAGNRVVFDIKGKKYRLIVKVHYAFGTVEIRFADTHAEYDKIDAKTI